MGFANTQRPHLSQWHAGLNRTIIFFQLESGIRTMDLGIKNVLLPSRPRTVFLLKSNLFHEPFVFYCATISSGIRTVSSSLPQTTESSKNISSICFERDRCASHRHHHIFQKKSFLSTHVTGRPSVGGTIDRPICHQCCKTVF